MPAPSFSMIKLRARWSATYALVFHPPFSRLARFLRTKTRVLRGKKPARPTRLLQVRWSQVLPSNPVHVVEARKAKGNVRISELALLAKAATTVASGREIVEIGTFDGRTTLNLAANSPPGTAVFTLDLPSDHPTQFALVGGERRYVDKPASGERYRRCGLPWSESAARIVQLYGDSATFDFSSRFGRAGLVFVDGSHAYEYAMKDTDTALQLIVPGGIVLWHDYGIWEGVTRALEEIEAARGLGLRHIRGTSLVFYCAK